MIAIAAPDETPGANRLIEWLRETDDPNTPYKPAIPAVHSRVNSYVYRIPGLKSGREHHLLSRLEYNAFLHFEFLPYRNIREQFPIPLALSRCFAERLGIKHHYDWKKREDVVMTTDFVLSLPGGGWLAIDVKPAAKLDNKRVKQKLALAAACWESVSVPHMVTTEKEQDPTIVDNYRKLHPLALPITDAPFGRDDMDRASRSLRELLRTGVSIREAAAHCERETGFGRGRLCQAAMWLIAHQMWSVDLSYPIGPDYPVRYDS